MVRSKVRIVHDILETIKENKHCKRTKIIRYANLDWDMAEKYLNALIDENFVEKRTEEETRGKESYIMIDKGRKFLESTEKIMKLTKIF